MSKNSRLYDEICRLREKKRLEAFAPFDERSSEERAIIESVWSRLIEEQKSHAPYGLMFMSTAGIHGRQG